MPLAGTEASDAPGGRWRGNAHLAYRPDIDGLRAVAVIPIVLFHAFPTAIRGGFVGVDIFFVISGYLITNIIACSFDRGGFSFADFYSRRIRRIFPALIVMLIACFGTGWFVLLADEYAQLGKHMLAAMGFVLNFVLLGEAGYFDVSAATKPLLHLWSLAVEEQFYLVWPALLLLTQRVRIDLRVTIAALGLLSFAANLFFAAASPVADFYRPVTRAWEFMAGAILVALPNRLTDRWRGRLSLFGLAALAVALFGPSQSDVYPGWWALAPVAGTVALIAAGPSTPINRDLLSHPLVVWFGLISYPLYLWHWPLLSYLSIIDTAEPPATLRFLAVIASVALAWLTYWLVEQPIRRQPRAPVLSAALCASMLAIGTIGLVTDARDGFTARLGHGLAFRIGPGYQALLASISSGKDFGRRQLVPCGLTGFPAEQCRRDARGPATAIVFGDSKAEAIFPGLVRNSPPGMAWMLVAHSACLPIIGIKVTDAYRQREGITPSICEAMTRGTIDAAAKDDLVRTILFAAAHHLLETQLTANDPDERKRQIDDLAARLLDTLHGFERPGKNVFFLIDNPSLADAKDCLPSRFFVADRLKAACSMPLADYLATVNDYRTLLRDLAADTNLRFIDPSAALCPDGECHVIENGRSLYNQTDHFSDYGNDIVGKLVVEVVGR